MTDFNPSEATFEHKSRSVVVDFFSRLFREKLLGTIGLTILLFMVIVALLAPVLATHDVNRQRLVKRLKGPSVEHLLGTDSYGRDFYSRLIYGARISLSVGLGGSLVAVVIATLVGGLSGYFGGKADMVIQRFVDAWYAFPGLLYLVTFVSIFGRGLVEIILLMGLYVGITQSRVVRSAVIAVKAIPYVESAKAAGCSTGRTLLRYILPNVTAPILIIFTTSIGGMILGEAALSFLGFGLPPQTPSWGRMLSWEGRMFMEGHPRLAWFPGLCLTAVVYSANVFGDALRDLLDPRLRGKSGGYGSVKKTTLKAR